MTGICQQCQVASAFHLTRIPEHWQAESFLCFTEGESLLHKIAELLQSLCCLNQRDTIRHAKHAFLHNDVRKLALGHRPAFGLLYLTALRSPFEVRLHVKHEESTTCVCRSFYCVPDSHAVGRTSNAGSSAAKSSQEKL